MFFIVIKRKKSRAIITIITECKVIELFCMENAFHMFYDAMITKKILRNKNVGLTVTY